MTKYRYYHTMAFWESFSKTLATIGGGANVVMGVVDQTSNVHLSSWLQIGCGLFSLGALALNNWLKDHNNNGILDIFEPVEIKDENEDTTAERKEI